MATPHYRLAGPGDIAALCDLINIGHRADHIPQVLSPAEVREEIDDAGDIATDVLLAVAGEPTDEIIGYIRTMYLPSDVLWERCYLFGSVHPEHRGRGIGQSLMAWGIARAATLLASSQNDLPSYIRVELADGVESGRRLFDRLGFRKVRVNEELLRPLYELPEILEPAGVRIVAWPADRDDEILTVKNAAFADHWGSTPTPAH
ncbi:MAG: GNAT family N-acetyltransferase, partial [Actinobacteria bacterium]|nr:GNAT family N-acetyltransferase [Actinomycetota bacterium]